jgi:hypothetical protein
MSLLVPKLQLGNSVLEAPASSLAKLELRNPGFQAGPLVILKTLGNPSYPPGSGYPAPWMASLNHPWRLDSGNPCRNDVHFIDWCKKMRAEAWEPAKSAAEQALEMVAQIARNFEELGV